MLERQMREGERDIDSFQINAVHFGELAPIILQDQIHSDQTHFTERKDQIHSDLIHSGEIHSERKDQVLL